MRRTLLEDTDSQERWLVSYADFMTLLFAFFVVMYAVSSVNEDKYRVLSNTLTHAFSRQEMSLDPIQIGQPTLSASPHVIDIPETSGFADAEPGDTHIQPSMKKVKEHLAGFIDDDLVRIRENNDWLEVAVQASLLFSSSSAELSVEAQAILNATAEFLLEFDNPVTIEGYSDNVPTQSARYASNWDLSTARAASVARLLVRNGVDRKRLAAVGYGENHPLETNATPEGRAQNRRVVIVVARQGNQPRNLNAKGASSAFAFIRHDEPLQLDERVHQGRTRSGGLIFTAPEKVDNETEE